MCTYLEDLVQGDVGEPGVALGVHGDAVRQVEEVSAPAAQHSPSLRVKGHNRVLSDRTLTSLLELVRRVERPTFVKYYIIFMLLVIVVILIAGCPKSMGPFT